MCPERRYRSAADRLVVLQDRWSVGRDYDEDFERAVWLTPTLVVAHSLTVSLVPWDPKRDPAVTLTVEVDSAEAWRVTQAQFKGEAITQLSIRSIPLTDLATAVVAHFAHEPGKPVRGAADRSEAFRALVAARKPPRRRRGALSTAELRRVAQVYRAALRSPDRHIRRAPTEQVARVFQCSRTHAGRHVIQAREEGLLPPTTRGKKQA